MSIFGLFCTKTLSASKECLFLGAEIQNFFDIFICSKRDEWNLLTFGTDAVVFVLQASVYYPDVLLIVVSEGDVAFFLFPVGRGQRVEDVDACV